MNKKPAYSLIYAFVFITVMLIVSTTVIKNIRGKIDYFDNIESASKAREAAESAAESAILLIKDEEAGYEPAASTIYPDSASTDTYGIYQVFSRAYENGTTGEYYTPLPHTGSAAPRSECSFLSGYESGFEDPNHACNWNKLVAGGSATIPLYAYDGSNLLNPDELGLNAWYLKVRTPCNNGSYAEDCDGGDRYSLDGDSSDYDTDDSVILWQLIGYDSTGATVVSELPDDYAEFGFSSFERDLNINTEIYESLVNEATDNIVLEANSTSSDSRYSDLYSVCSDTTIETLILQLDVVNQLVDASSGGSVPYLEWQLVWEGSDPNSDTKATIIGRGYHESSLGIFLYPFVISRSTIAERAGTYTISN